MVAETLAADLAPDLTAASHVVNCLRERIRAEVMGRDEAIDLVLVALLADGHILLEDYPGLGKTTLAKALGQSIVEDVPLPEIAPFRRVQFTPDLLPSDITGVMVFDSESSRFDFRRGPIFAQVLLVDEINRTSPKVQAALLEAMAEKQVTVDNVSHPLGELFFVIATQNPLDVAGTYPLPLAQIDRFLFKVRMKHIDRESELKVIDAWGMPHEPTALPPTSSSAVLRARRAIRVQVHVADPIKACLVDIARHLRADRRVLQGVSTRALVQAIPALQTVALMRGRDFVSSEDVVYILPLLFAHRLELVPGSEPAEEVAALATRELVESLSRQTLRAR